MFGRINKSEFRFFLMCILCFLGVVCTLGSINYGITDGWFYAISGIANIAIVVLMILAEYKRYSDKTQ